MISIHTIQAIPVSVMLQLNVINSTGHLANPSQFTSQMAKLKSGNVNGVMSDLWWGIAEGDGPCQYNFQGYLEMASIVRSQGLTLQFVSSFHQCGGNVGDNCNIPLPSWVVKVAREYDLFYKDAQGRVNPEYLSLSADTMAVFPGCSPSSPNRTALTLYSDFLTEMRSTFYSYLKDSTLDQIQVGMGPAGELRYPSYPQENGVWTYCGVGQVQCYDTHMLANLSASATAAGHPEWGKGGPDNAGNYDSCPSSTDFWRTNNQGANNYQSEYGNFFLSWYSDQLLTHAVRVLAVARDALGNAMNLAVKVAGIHWWYGDPSHAAECGAGYYNTNNNNAYLKIAQLLANFNAEFDFTALEMLDNTNPGTCQTLGENACGSKPQELVKQTIQASKQLNVPYAGENALPICPDQFNVPCNKGGFEQVFKESTQYGPIARFTFLRLSENLLNNPGNWAMFQQFVFDMGTQ